MKLKEEGKNLLNRARQLYMNENLSFEKRKELENITNKLDTSISEADEAIETILSNEQQ